MHCRSERLYRPSDDSAFVPAPADCLNAQQRVQISYCDSRPGATYRKYVVPCAKLGLALTAKLLTASSGRDTSDTDRPPPRDGAPMTRPGAGNDAPGWSNQPPGRSAQVLAITGAHRQLVQRAPRSDGKGWPLTPGVCLWPSPCAWRSHPSRSGSARHRAPGREP